MPGILYHLAFAEAVYQKCKDIIKIEKIEFMSGNLIPDYAVAGKDKTHYQKPASVKGFYVPEMELVKRDLFVPNDSVKFGMYCHLYLDHYFISGFLIPEFIWDTDRYMVINPRNGKEWTVKDFFSHKGMYGSYTEINQMMLRDDHIPLETVNEIPEILPKTGMPLYDVRKEKTWKTELEEYMAEKKEYTGDVFDYVRLWEYIERIAGQFADEIRNVNKNVTDVKLLGGYIKY